MANTRQGHRDDLLTLRTRHGFTLIELLASMSILVLIVMLMSRIYAETTNMWQLGSRRVIAAAEGRVIMDFLVRELTMAIADEHVTFRTVSPGSDGQSHVYGAETYGAEADEIFFVGMVRRGHTSSYRRTGNQFCYFVTEMVDEDDNIMPYRYRLVRTRKTRSMYRTQSNREESAYMQPDWWNFQVPSLPHFNLTGPHAVETIAENIAAFEIWAWSEQADNYQANYRSRNEDDLLPVWADIYVELLGEEDAIRAAELWQQGDTPEARLFVDNQARRYMARVFFTNRERAKSFL